MEKPKTTILCVCVEEIYETSCIQWYSSDEAPHAPIIIKVSTWDIKTFTLLRDIMWTAHTTCQAFISIIAWRRNLWGLDNIIRLKHTCWGYKIITKIQNRTFICQSHHITTQNGWPPWRFKGVAMKYVMRYVLLIHSTDEQKVTSDQEVWHGGLVKRW